MIIRHVPPTPLVDGPLDGTKLPMTLEDVALQMAAILSDGADIAVCHIEADRLLLRALTMIEGIDQELVQEIVNTYNQIEKIYE